MGAWAGFWSEAGVWMEAKRRVGRDLVLRGPAWAKGQCWEKKKIHKSTACCITQNTELLTLGSSVPSLATENLILQRSWPPKSVPPSNLIFPLLFFWSDSSSFLDSFLYFSRPFLTPLPWWLLHLTYTLLLSPRSPTRCTQFTRCQELHENTGSPGTLLEWLVNSFRWWISFLPSPISLCPCWTHRLSSLCPARPLWQAPFSKCGPEASSIS